MTSLSHKDDYFETPDWLFQQIQDETGLEFKIDIACNNKNKKTILAWAIDEPDPMDDGFYDGLIMPICITAWCNPPRSENGKWVNHVYKEWQKRNQDIVMLLCWNDLGNKYGEKLLPHILNGEIIVKNLGKIKFNKNGKESKFVSRLTYFWAWFKSD